MRAYRKSLHFETEHELNRQPLLIDLLVVKKDPEVQIDNGVAKARVAAIKEGLAEGMSEGYDNGMKKGLGAGMQQGMQQGKELGAKEGRLEAIQAVVKRMLGHPGFTRQDICNLPGGTPDEVRRTADSMGVVPA